MPHQNDIPLTHNDIQTLSSADRLAAFFARLDYLDEARLGIVAPYPFSNHAWNFDPLA